jgi:hypothetical protein
MLKEMAKFAKSLRASSLWPSRGRVGAQQAGEPAFDARELAAMRAWARRSRGKKVDLKRSLAADAELKIARANLKSLKTIKADPWAAIQKSGCGQWVVWGCLFGALIVVNPQAAAAAGLPTLACVLQMIGEAIGSAGGWLVATAWSLAGGMACWASFSTLIVVADELFNPSKKMARTLPKKVDALLAERPGLSPSAPEGEIRLENWARGKELVLMAEKARKKQTRLDHFREKTCSFAMTAGARLWLAGDRLSAGPSWLVGAPFSLMDNIPWEQPGDKAKALRAKWLTGQEARESKRILTEGARRRTLMATARWGAADIEAARLALARREEAAAAKKKQRQRQDVWRSRAACAAALAKRAARWPGSKKLNLAWIVAEALGLLAVEAPVLWAAKAGALAIGRWAGEHAPSFAAGGAWKAAWSVAFLWASAGWIIALALGGLCLVLLFMDLADGGACPTFPARKIWANGIGLVGLAMDAWAGPKAKDQTEPSVVARRWEALEIRLAAETARTPAERGVACAAAKPRRI